MYFIFKKYYNYLVSIFEKYSIDVISINFNLTNEMSLYLFYKRNVVPKLNILALNFHHKFK